MKRARSINRLTICWSVFNGSKCLCSSAGVVRENAVPYKENC